MPVSPELEKYIAEAKQKGMTDEIIRQELARVGWDTSDVSAAFVDLEGPPSSPLPSSPLPSIAQSPEQVQTLEPSATPMVQATVSASGPSHKLKTIIVVSAALLFLGAVGAAAYVFLVPMLSDGAPYDTNTFLSDLTKNISRIETSVYTATLLVKTEPRNASVQSLRDVFPEYIPTEEVSYQGRASEPFITQMIRGEDSYFSMLPSDLEAEVSVQGDIKKSEGGGIKPIGRIGVRGSFTTPDFSMNADIEFIAHDGVFYGKINRMPAFLFFNFDQLKGKWVKLGDVASSTPKSFGFDEEETARAFNAIKQIPRIADETQVLSAVQNPQKEELSGETVYRYDLRLDPDNLLIFFDRMTPILRESIPEDRRGEFDLTTAEQRQKIADPTFVKFINYIQNQSSFSVWVSAESKLPVRVATFVYMAPSKGSSLAQSNNANPKQLTVGTSLALSAINERVTVEAPEEFITMEEAYKLMSQTSGY